MRFLNCHNEEFYLDYGPSGIGKSRCQQGHFFVESQNFDKLNSWQEYHQTHEISIQLKKKIVKTVKYKSTTWFAIFTIKIGKNGTMEYRWRDSDVNWFQFWIDVN